MGLGERTDRRTLLRTVASGAAGLTLGSTASTTGARIPPPEEECDERAIRECDRGGAGGSDPEPWDVPIVSTRGQFYIDTDCGWFGICGFSAHLRDEYGEYEYEIPDRSAPIPWDAEEVVVYSHGWNSDSMAEAVEGAKEVDHQFRNPIGDLDVPGTRASRFPHEGGYVGFTWDSAVQPGPEKAGIAFEDQEEIGYRNGKKAAEFITDLKERGETDTTVHWVAHSMGGHVTYGLLEDLHRRGESIDSVSLWAPAVPEESPNMDNYGPIIEDTCRVFDVFHYWLDGALTIWYEVEKFNEALGARGIEGTPPCNYEQHDMSWVWGGRRPSRRPKNEYHFLYHDGARAGRQAAALAMGEYRPPAGERPRRPEDCESSSGDAGDSGDDESGADACGAVVNVAVERGSLDGVADRTVFEYTVQGNACEVRLALSGPTDADFDLFVTRDGAAPTRGNSDRRSRGATAEERISVDGSGLARGADLGVAVESHAGSGAFELTVTEFGTPDGPEREHPRDDSDGGGDGRDGVQVR